MLTPVAFSWLLPVSASAGEPSSVTAIHIWVPAILVACLAAALASLLTLRRRRLSLPWNQLTLWNHELRSPLQALQLHLELMADSGLDPAQRRHLEDIHGCAHQIRCLLDELAACEDSRGDTGPAPTLRPVDLAPCLEAIVLPHAAQAFAKGLRFNLMVSRDAPAMAQVDPTLLAQAVTNLVTNAIRYTDSGAVSVALRDASRLSTEPAFVVEVSDTGPGLSHRESRRVLRPFQRGAAAFGTSGSGLGLAVCAQLVARMGGRLRLKRRWPNGTAARVLIPVGKVPKRWHQVRNRGADDLAVTPLTEDRDLSRVIRHAARRCGAVIRDTASKEMDGAHGPCRRQLWLADTDSPAAWQDAIQRLPEGAELVALARPGARIDPALKHGQKRLRVVLKPLRQADLEALFHASAESVQVSPLVRRPRPGDQAALPAQRPVLLIDDDAVARRVLRHFLRELGRRVEEAQTPVEALRLCRRERFGLILMDLHLPGMTGLQASERIHSDPAGRNRNTPVIALTGSARPAPEGEPLPAHLADYLRKPVDKVALAALLARQAGGGSAHGRTA